MNPTIPELLVALSGSFLLSIVAKATCAAGIALVVARFMWRARASVRHLILTAAFAVLLLLPLGGGAIPSLDVAVEMRAAPADSLVRVRQTDARPDAGSAEVTIPPAFSGDPPNGSSVAHGLLVIWAAGAILFSLPVAAGLWQINRLRRSGVPWHHGQETADTAASAAGVRRPLAVLVHGSVVGPMTCGFIRPAVMFPSEAVTWERAHVARALLHEVEHVRRGDWIIHCLARVGCALYWFHPFVWMCWRRLNLEAERACDDAVVRATEPTAYAEQLVALAQKHSTTSNQPLLAMASRRELPARVAALLDTHQRRGPVGRRTVIGVVLTAAVTSIVIVPMRVVDAAVRSAQAPTPAASAAAFDVASVKVNRSGEVGARLRPVEDGGALNAVNMPLSELIRFAYQLPPERIQEIPDWALTTRYDIVAKAGGPAATAGSPAPGLLRSALMLRSLLAERFELKVRRETRELQIYELRWSEGSRTIGPRLVRTTRDCRTFVNPLPAPRANEIPCGVGFGFGYMSAGGVPLSDFAEALGRIVQRPVVDRTGLAGTFDLEIAFDSEQQVPNLPPGVGPPRVDSNAPSIFTALQEQLGLKLEPSRGPVEVLVIDSVERPTPD